MLRDWRDTHSMRHFRRSSLAGFSGEPRWPKTQASECLPLRAYRMLSRTERRDVVIVLKIGTYDDTLASHFVVVDPANPGPPDDDNVPIFDPAQPMNSQLGSLVQSCTV